MRKFFKVLLIIVACLLVIVGIGAIFIATRSLPKFKVEQPVVKIEYTPQRVEQGAKLAGMLCRSCHYDNETKKFTGGELTEAPQFGKIYAKNITQHPEAGIGKWTDSELVYFIRTGIRPDGQYVPPYMPKLVHISDEDMYSIIAFLRSDNSWVAADAKKQPASEPSFLTKFLVTIKAVEPFPYPANPIPQPDTNDMVKLGKYISLYQLECFSCHSQDFAKNDYFTPEKSPGFFGGGNKLYNKEGQELHSLNITMHEKNGIGSWTEEEFVKAVKFGQVPNNQPALRYPMTPYSQLTDKEAKAIFAYLKTVPKLDNKVERKFAEQ
jgi:mono/diheme cytochrome c family protein